MKPCARAQCPAVPDVAVCRVHAPDKIISRVLDILTRRFEKVIATHETGSPSDEELKKLRADILRDLEATV